MPQAVGKLMSRITHNLVYSNCTKNNTRSTILVTSLKREMDSLLHELEKNVSELITFEVLHFFESPIFPENRITVVK